MSKKILVVGGVAGGASAAARLRRLDENARIIMFEKDNYISFANCGLPYYIGEKIKERQRLLVQTPESMHARFNIDVRVNSKVTNVDTDKNTVKVKEKGGRTYEESYDYLILLAVTVIMVVFSFYENKKMQRIFFDNRKKMGNINSSVQDSLLGIRVVKSFANEGIERKKFDKNNNAYRISREKSYKVMGKFIAGNTFFEGLLYVVILVSGAFFIAELGDKTQLAALTLAARYQSFWPVWLGASAGMILAIALAVGLGYFVGRRIPEKALKWLSAGIFGIFGVITIVTAWGGL